MTWFRARTRVLPEAVTTHWPSPLSLEHAVLETEVQCVVTRESDCKAELGLTWSGANTTCDDAVCTASCEGDTTGNGVVDFTDLISVLNNWGPCS